LSAGFNQTGVLLLMEKNYKVHRSLQGEPLPPDFSIKRLVEEVLTTSGFRERRARTMDIDDFMQLLHAFNAAGIHFV
jgi:18S rRNA (adenine1779-N6/adenine1780-N6)-dimethyltransferase